jgi:hypothetical protein
MRAHAADHHLPPPEGSPPSPSSAQNGLLDPEKSSIEIVHTLATPIATSPDDMAFSQEITVANSSSYDPTRPSPPPSAPAPQSKTPDLDSSSTSTVGYKLARIVTAPAHHHRLQSSLSSTRNNNNSNTFNPYPVLDDDFPASAKPLKQRFGAGFKQLFNKSK